MCALVEHGGDGGLIFSQFLPLLLQLVFQAMDREKHVIDTQLGIDIRIIDSNDNPPKFDREMYPISIEESKSQGKLLIF